MATTLQRVIEVDLVLFRNLSRAKNVRVLPKQTCKIGRLLRGNGADFLASRNTKLPTAQTKKL